MASPTRPFSRGSDFGARDFRVNTDVVVALRRREKERGRSLVGSGSRSRPSRQDNGKARCFGTLCSFILCCVAA